LRLLHLSLERQQQSHVVQQPASQNIPAQATPVHMPMITGVHQLSVN